jgi:TonB-linked SusC/RagA family outer membrane protein
MLFKLKTNVHMRKIASLLSVLMLLCTFAFGQARTVSGQVKDEKGEGVPYATIAEAGKPTNATKADVNGFFSIKIAEGSQLTLTAVGFDTKSVSPAGGTGLQVFNIATKDASLVEVTVTTGQGIKKRPKELGFATASVNPTELTNGKSPALAQALSGKVSGLTITNTSNSVTPGVKINLRGFRSMTGNNDALIVLDGVPVPQNAFAYLNPNDVADVTVLKGGQAATLYGSDGVNGAILITTKAGSKSKPQVQVSTSWNFEQLSFLPKFQEEFGQGSDYGGLNAEENFRTYENQQYGDRYDGSIRPLGRVLEDGSVLELPYSAIKDVRKKVWDLGFTNTNDVAVSGGDQTSRYYLSFQDALTKGIVPGDKARRSQARFSASKEFGKVTTSFKANYIQETIDRTTTDFYFNVLNNASNIPLNDFRDWKNNKFANPNGYWNDYQTNPWFDLDNNRQTQNNNYFNGNVDVTFKATSWLSITERLGIAMTNAFSKGTQGKFIYSDYAKHGAYVPAPWPANGTGFDEAQNDVLGGVSDGAGYGRRTNNDFLITANKDFGKFSTRLTVGQNLQVRKSKNINVSSGSIVIPELFNVANRTGELGGGESNTEQRKYGYYADATAGYNDYLFLHGSARIDGTSLFYLPGRDKKKYQYAYYGADLSFILTEAFPSIKSDIFSYAKLRAGYNKNGNDNIATYQLALTYGLGGGFPYGNVAGTSVGDNFPDPSLSPEFVTSYEAGGEFAFWKNRFNLDVTAYKQISKDQALSVALPPSTGFLSALINVGRSDSWGYEADLRANVIKSKKFNWDVSIRYSHNDNEVKELFGDLSRLNPYGGGFTYAQVTAEKGQSFPYLRTLKFQRDPEGRVIVDANNGYPQRTTALEGAGNTFPKTQLGLGTTLKYGNFSFSANAEYRGDYVIYHDLGRTMTFTGSAKITALYGRTAFVYPNSSYFDGSKYVPNTNIATENGHYRVWVDHVRQVPEVFTTSGAFWKLRDINLTYTIPASVLQKAKFIKAANVSVFGRNLITLLPKENWYTDPEFSTAGTGNGLGINTTTNTPAVRNFGASLTVTF